MYIFILMKTKGGENNLATVYVKQINRNQYLSKEEYEEAQHIQFEDAFKKFKKEVLKENIVKNCRDRMYYISKSEKEKAKKKAGRRKQLKQMSKERRFEDYNE